MKSFIALALLVASCVLLSAGSCGGKRERADKVVKRPGVEYDEALYRGKPLGELAVVTILPSFNNVEELHIHTPQYRTDCQILITANNSSVYKLQGMTVKAVLIVDRNGIILPSDEMKIVMTEAVYKTQKFGDVGGARGGMESVPAKTPLKIGEEFVIEGNRHVEFTIQCVLKEGAEKDEPLYAAVVFADGGGRARIVKTDPVSVRQWMKDWGK